MACFLVSISQGTPCTVTSNCDIGYDTGIISAVLVYIGTSLDHKILSSGEKELITSITSGAAFFGAIFAGLTSDRYGRKMAIYVGCVLFILGAILQAASFTLAQMTVGRLVVGFGVGSAAMIGIISSLHHHLYMPLTRV